MYFNAQRDQERQCIVVVIGADEGGRKDLVGPTDGCRESEQSCRELLVDLGQRGLETGPELAIADGNLRFWKAGRQVYGAAREQRRWVHKTANVLKLPRGVEAKTKQNLHAIGTRGAAKPAFDHFVNAYAVKYGKAAARLVKDRETLLNFCDVPAEAWKQVRTTNPGEYTFAIVRLQTTRTTVTADRPDDGLRALPERPTALATHGWAIPARRSRSRRAAVHRWRTAASERRLMLRNPQHSTIASATPRR